MDKKQLRIAFGCQSGVGKTTATNYLINEYGGVDKSFASPVYNIQNYFQEITGIEKVKNRKILQTIGTLGRDLDENIWVNILLRDVDKIQDNVYVSDVRFLNELKSLKEKNFFTVRILRNCQNKDFGMGSGSHISEMELSTEPLKIWDCVIENNGTLDEFYGKLDKLVKNLSSQ